MNHLKIFSVNIGNSELMLILKTNKLGLSD